VNFFNFELITKKRVNGSSEISVDEKTHFSGKSHTEVSLAKYFLK